MAYDRIQHFEQYPKKFEDFKYISNIEIYNQLLSDKANSSSNSSDLLNYFRVFREKNLEPNIHSYAICLYGLYKIAQINEKFDDANRLLVHRILNDIEKFVNSIFL